MLDALRRDFTAISGMTFQDVPDLRDVLASIEQLEHDINTR
jgi:hypothetical protein